jgi:hypothetical protein
MELSAVSKEDRASEKKVLADKTKKAKAAKDKKAKAATAAKAKAAKAKGGKGGKGAKGKAAPKRTGVKAASKKRPAAKDAGVKKAALRNKSKRQSALDAKRGLKGGKGGGAGGRGAKRGKAPKVKVVARKGGKKGGDGGKAAAGVRSIKITFKTGSAAKKVQKAPPKKRLQATRLQSTTVRRVCFYMQVHAYWTEQQPTTRPRVAFERASFASVVWACPPTSLVPLTYSLAFSVPARARPKSRPHLHRSSLSPPQAKSKVLTGKAKRQAALNARRGIAPGKAVGRKRAFAAKRVVVVPKGKGKVKGKGAKGGKGGGKARGAGGAKKGGRGRN